MSNDIASAKRDAAARWYEERAAERTGTTTATLWTYFAKRVRSGDADRFIDRILNEMIEFDRNPTK